MKICPYGHTYVHTNYAMWVELFNKLECLFKLRHCRYLNGVVQVINEHKIEKYCQLRQKSSTFNMLISNSRICCIFYKQLKILVDVDNIEQRKNL